MNLYLNRLRKEKASDRAKNPRTGWLSTNTKTGFSLNFPIGNCRPTPLCAAKCYACTGPMVFRNSVSKSLALEDAVRESPDQLVMELGVDIRRGGLTHLRYSGGGDLSSQGASVIIRLATEHPSVRFWGFTKIVPVHAALEAAALPNLSVIFSLDKSSPRTSVEYCRKVSAKTAWMATVDGPPEGKHFVVFPDHSAGKPYIGMKKVARECPAIRNHTQCGDCMRCIRKEAA